MSLPDDAGLPRTRVLSKSKLIAFRQCPKRLWLEIHHPERRADTKAAQAGFEIGYQVGSIAQHLYDPDTPGTVVDPSQAGVGEAIAKSAELLRGMHPIFEAGLSAGGALAFADVMLPSTNVLGSWRMIEVKSATSVKGYHRDDVAIQAFVAAGSGIELESVALAHIDSGWVYPGGDNYAGLLVEVDLTAEAKSRATEVERWIAEAQAVAALEREPSRTSGSHCHDPYGCGFLIHCQSGEPQAEFPVTVLPRSRAKPLQELIAGGVTDLYDIPDELLSLRQLRVKTSTISNETFFDAEGAAEDLAAHPLPAYFLDFETTQFAVPIWQGTRPYQQIPFQFSVHTLDSDEVMNSDAFLDLTGEDPSRRFAEALLRACAEPWPLFVYNAAFEKTRVAELAARFADLSDALVEINSRVVDLLPVAQQRYYHPSQAGSWSIKVVLPAIEPDLSYEALDGVKDGGAAMAAYREAIHAQTSLERCDEIRHQLLKYCALDTYAMVRLWQFFTGRRSPIAAHAEAT